MSPSASSVSTSSDNNRRRTGRGEQGREGQAPGVTAAEEPHQEQDAREEACGLEAAKQAERRDVVGWEHREREIGERRPEGFEVLHAVAVRALDARVCHLGEVPVQHAAVGILVYVRGR